MSRIWTTFACLTLFLAAASARANTITTVDTGGVGQYNSAVYGTDGLALIAYYDATNGDLKVAHCQNVACTASSRNTLDSAGDVGQSASLAIGANGLGIISYFDATNARLKVARCNDVACSTASTVTLGNVGPAANGTDLAVPPDGRPVIAFRADPSVLRVARCVDAACSDATAVTIDNVSGVLPRITIGGDGLPLVARTGFILWHCDAPDCSVTTPIDVRGPEPDGGGTPIVTSSITDVTTTPDGLGAIAVRQETTFIGTPTHSVAAGYRQCADPACTSLFANSNAFLASAPISVPLPAQPSLAVRANGLPLLASNRPTQPDALAIADCTMPSCNGTAAYNVDGPLGGSLHSSVAISPAGIGLVAYRSEAAGGSLKTIYLDTTTTADAAVTISASPDPVGAGQLIEYRLGATSLGPELARGPTITLSLPPGLVDPPEYMDFRCRADAPGTLVCLVDDLEPGQTAFVIIVNVRVPPGVTGPLTATATVTTASNDPNAANNAASATIGTLPSVRVRSSQVVEGDSGTQPATFDVELVDDGSTHGPITAAYTLGGGSASSGSDYLPLAGTLTFAPATTTHTVTVAIVGDLVAEDNENFFLQLSPAGALTHQDTGLLILDDDPYRPALASLNHGVTIVGDLATSAGADYYLLETTAPYASYEVIADSVSGDAQPVVLYVRNPDGSPLATSTPTAHGAVLQWSNFDQTPVLNRVVQLLTFGCTPSCGPDDIYRLRVYETTARIARFNNTGDQQTVLILQNPSNEPQSSAASVVVNFWNAAGERIGVAGASLFPHGTAVINTATIVPGQSGSITIQHPLPYGVLQGKAVALEPATGFSFDSPLTYWPK